MKINMDTLAALYSSQAYKEIAENWRNKTNALEQLCRDAKGFVERQESNTPSIKDKNLNVRDTVRFLSYLIGEIEILTNQLCTIADLCGLEPLFPRFLGNTASITTVEVMENIGKIDAADTLSDNIAERLEKLA